MIYMYWSPFRKFMDQDHITSGLKKISVDLEVENKPKILRNVD